MSIVVEIASLVGGMMAELATQRNWGIGKIFMTTVLVFFLLFAGLVIVFPSERGVGVGLGFAAGVGVGSGLIVVALIHIARKKRKER